MLYKYQLPKPKTSWSHWTKAQPLRFLMVTILRHKRWHICSSCRRSTSLPTGRGRTLEVHKCHCLLMKKNKTQSILENMNLNLGRKKRSSKATSKTFQRFHLIHIHQGFGLASRSKEWLGLSRLSRPCCMKIEAALWLIHPTGLFIRIPVTELATL